MPKPDKPAPSVKHPHVRGEDSSHFFPLAPTIETPPRAWGRRWMRIGLRLSARNTPTCVGKTQNTTNMAMCQGETPPRAWGRRLGCSLVALCRRNTPTCVGKTIQRKNVKNERRKHPHVRGEDYNAALRKAQRERNTPTCVGKTPA